MMYHRVALPVVEHWVLSLQEQPSAEPHLSWQVSVQTGRYWWKQLEFERRKIYLVISISASIFLNCSLWYFFWHSNKIHYGNCVRLPGNSVKIWKETSSVMKMRVVFLLCPLCDLVAKHPQTRNIPQWFSQKPCENQLSSLLITQA